MPSIVSQISFAPDHLIDPNIRTGAFGSGVDAHILEAYTFFSNNYDEGDELFLFGFSRRIYCEGHRVAHL